MKNWTNSIALALAAATLTLTAAACAEPGPADVADEADAPEPIPGDPAVYAPDGWPFEIGDRMPTREISRRTHEFRVPGIAWTTRNATSKLHLVGGRVYAPLYEWDPTKLGEYPWVYRGHFPVRLPESMRELEPAMPPEFHGRIEYYTPQPSVYRGPTFEQIDAAVDKLSPEQRYYWETSRTLGRTIGPDGRVINVDPFHVPGPPDPLVWPDYPERRESPERRK